MRDPCSQLLFQKGMALRTTSQTMLEGLHGRFCRHNHEHQTLEGSTKSKGISLKRTEFSERYTRKFAQLIARLLTKSTHDTPKGYYEEVPALAAAAKRKKQSKADSSTQVNKRPRVPMPRLSLKRDPARLVKPDDLPEKRPKTGTT